MPSTQPASEDCSSAGPRDGEVTSSETAAIHVPFPGVVLQWGCCPQVGGKDQPRMRGRMYQIPVSNSLEL